MLVYQRPSALVRRLTTFLACPPIAASKPRKAGNRVAHKHRIKDVEVAVMPVVVVVLKVLKVAAPRVPAAAQTPEVRLAEGKPAVALPW